MSYCCTFMRSCKLTVVMITHDLDSLFRTCDRVGVIVDGRMITDTLAGNTAEYASLDTRVLSRSPGARRRSSRGGGDAHG